MAVNSDRVVVRPPPGKPVSAVLNDPDEDVGGRCRLLYLVGQLGPGGLERQLWYLLQAMDRRRYRPSVVAWNLSEANVYVPRIRSLNVPLYSLSDADSPARKLNAFRLLIRQLAPEVVHSYSFYTNFAAYWGTRGTGAVAVGSVRSDFSQAKSDCSVWLGRLSARWPRDQIYNSSSAAQACQVSRSLFVPKRVTIVRNGLDLERFHAAPSRVAGKLIIVGVGSLLPVKRWDRLCRVAAELKARGYDHQIQIIGEGWLREKLERQAADLGVSDCVKFIGYADDVQGLLTEARFLVHTSDSEGCPNVIMEAMACGRAVVATDVGDTSSLVNDGTTGFVVPRGDETTLLARMVTLITDQELCQRMGLAGRAKAERQFGLERLVRETLAAYRDMGWRDS